jgi:two-component system, LytTR family, sensor kinase
VPVGKKSVGPARPAYDEGVTQLADRALFASPRWLGRAALITAAWTLVGLLSIGQRSLSDVPLEASHVVRSLWSVWLWAALTPLILRCAARFPLAPGDWVRPVLIHLLLAAAFHVADVLIDQAASAALPALVEEFRHRLVSETFINVFSYAATVAAGHALAYYRLFHERRLRAARLEAELVAARLAALELQLRPHFLFNSLHTIAALIRTGERDLAVRTVAEIGELLRAVLKGGERHEVPLREELELTRRYLGIEELRFGDRLATDIAADPDALDGMVPRLVLQPLVENAVRHGVEQVGTGRVEVNARVDGDMLVVRVIDSAPDGGRAPSGGAGIALANCRERLRSLHGAAFRLERTASPQGTTVELAVPYHVTARSLPAVRDA